MVIRIDFFIELIEFLIHFFKNFSLIFIRQFHFTIDFNRISETNR